jgi:hypothetical protein
VVKSEHPHRAETYDANMSGAGDWKTGIDPKAVITQHVVGKDGGRRRYLLKSAGNHINSAKYQESMKPAWSEMTAQAIFHAAGMGNNCQKVHVSEINGHHATVVHMEEGYHMADSWSPNLHPSPKAETLRRIAVIDNYISNRDRHSQNILVHLEDDHGNDGTGHVVCIDHGRAFAYHRRAPERQVSGLLEPDDAFDIMHKANIPTPETYKWWQEVAPKMREAFHKHADLLPPQEAQHYKESEQRLYEAIENRLRLAK